MPFVQSIKIESSIINGLGLEIPLMVRNWVRIVGKDLDDPGEPLRMPVVYLDVVEQSQDGFQPFGSIYRRQPILQGQESPAEIRRSREYFLFLAVATAAASCVRRDLTSLYLVSCERKKTSVLRRFSPAIS